jgi:hypothetical protein
MYPEKSDTPYPTIAMRALSLRENEEVGYYSLAFAITSPVVVFTMFQLRGFQVTDTKNEFDFQDYLCIRLITIFFSMAIVAGVLIFLAGRYGMVVPRFIKSALKYAYKAPANKAGVFVMWRMLLTRSSG